MRILTIIILAVFTSGVLATSIAPFASATSPQPGDQIQIIRKQFATTNRKLRKYRTVKKELSGFSTEGGELIAYFDGPVIMKIAATFFGESGKAIEEYYYWDSKLIFIFRKESRYSKPLSGKVVATTENRFYFSNDKLIRWINEHGKPISSDTSEFGQRQTEFLESSRQFTDGVRSAKTVIESH